jgi:hypothetical protein
MTKTAIRFRPIRSTSALAAATCHALRQDAIGKARVRPGAVAGHALSWTAHGVADRDHLAAWKAHKLATGAAERKNAPLGLQAICVVGPEWIDAAGDRHDEANPRNAALFREARAWAESWAGPGSVIAARLDLDERGGGVVDLTIVPVRVQRSRGGRETLRISTNAALQALCDETGEAKSFAAAQTSWATWCQRTLDSTLERGTPREMTGAQHLRPEEYGRVADELGELREQIAALEAERTGLTTALEDARAEVALALAERDEARQATQRLLERAQEAARARIAAAQRRAQEVAQKALQDAEALKEKGKSWAARMKAKVVEQTEAERAQIRIEIEAEADQLRADAVANAEAAGREHLERILAPARTFMGRLGLIKVRTEAEREEERAAITKAVRDDEAGVRATYLEARDAAEARAQRAESAVKGLTERLAERTAERDQAQARLRALEPPTLGRDRSYGPSLGR